MMLSPRVRSFLMSKLRFPVLATLNPDGSIQQSVMWFDLDGDQVLMNTKAGRAKHRNLTANGIASLCFEEMGAYVTLSGRCEVIDDPERGQADIYRLAVRYDGEESARQQVAEAYSSQERTTILMTIERVFVHGLPQDEAR
jgi:PPOX class probable F420-dependent enzyme